MLTRRCLFASAFTGTIIICTKKGVYMAYRPSMVHACVRIRSYLCVDLLYMCVMCMFFFGPSPLDPVLSMADAVVERR